MVTFEFLATNEYRKPFDKLNDNFVLELMQTLRLVCDGRLPRKF